MIKRKSFLLAAVVAAVFSMAAATPSHAAGSISWYTSLDSGLAAAKKSGKPVFIYFWATWCGPCKLMVKKVYPKPAVVAESKKWVMIKLDYDKNAAAVKKYKVAATLPQYLFVTPKGKLVKKTASYLDEKKLISAMRGAHSSAKG